MASENGIVGKRGAQSRPSRKLGISSAHARHAVAVGRRKCSRMHAPATLLSSLSALCRARTPVQMKSNSGCLRYGSENFTDRQRYDGRLGLTLLANDGNPRRPRRELVVRFAVENACNSSDVIFNRRIIF